MKNTVVIFNAGIGALTLGFQNAGYEILKAYEPDRKVIEIYQKNISHDRPAGSVQTGLLFRFLLKLGVWRY